jgi:hypothetical protein
MNEPLKIELYKTKVERSPMDKHLSLSDPFVSYEKMNFTSVSTCAELSFSTRVDVTFAAISLTIWECQRTNTKVHYLRLKGRIEKFLKLTLGFLPDVLSPQIH